ncbi:AN1-type zinc finger protein 4-like isoform X1 [Mercenaria mercenaria]|uniref:AN1-type zinc finger protein 4-like isoform X1 n=1 Tax=Mercenaria mercenaria TaxID=6596 RepID=UPI00234EC061|nr:AN1-type zinc finger protein 4-like isoform X1 [Mercenaria mercenaria]
MELYIETLTGAAFELRVSPFETIMSVKAKIQRLEGIPIAQQHLIWKSVELEDDYCLHDYSIHDGATLKLVLAMRGGPINTRRIPMEDPALREMAEYVEANRDEIWEKLPGNRQVTLLVFREGDQLNFFRVVDRGDGTLTPLSESLSGASMYNFNDEEDEEDAPTKEKVEENEQLKEKMKQIRLKMDKLNISKKPHRKPHPPTSGRAGSRSSRLRHLPASTSYSLGPTLNRNLCLPPVGHSIGTMSHHHHHHPSSLALQHQLLKERIERLDREEEKERAQAAFDSSVQAIAGPSTSKLSDDSDDSDGPTLEELSTAASHQLDSLERLSQVLSRVIEGGAANKEAENKTVQNQEKDKSSETVEKSSSEETVKPVEAPPKASEKENSDKTLNESPNCDNGIESATPANVRRELLRLSSQAGENSACSRPVTSSKIKDVTLENLRESLRPPNSSKGKSKIKTEYSLFDSLRDSIGASSSLSRHSSLDKRKEFTLESLSTSEARAMSGLLRQASLEKVGSSRIGNVTVTSASRNRVTGNYMLGNSTFPDGRITTPEGRLVSARLQRMTASRDGRILSPTHRLPPVKAKKKGSKRCFVCAKKTGLACSYTCRCGNNFCASHRYAESHECTFDYKTEGRKLLEQNNPVVSAPKLPKI